MLSSRDLPDFSHSWHAVRQLNNSILFQIMSMWRQVLRTDNNLTFVIDMEQQQARAPQEVRNVAKFLRSGAAGMKTRVGVLNGKRMDYFKGSLSPLCNSVNYNNQVL